MKYMGRENDIIGAISTPPGLGGISVIRVSGPKCCSLVSKITPFLPKTPESHRVYYGKICSSSGTEIDEVMVTFFAEGRSFTGDETVEISCHGNPEICDAILVELSSLGLRIAERGEFTYRAFSNGRIDLVQAESVLNLIQSNGNRARRQALRDLEGELSRSLKSFESEFLGILANIEAEIDFSTEDIIATPIEEIIERIFHLRCGLETLANTFKEGRALKDGRKIVILGEPNVGKSSLLNRIVGWERAIVSEIPGTTRDTVEETTIVSGQKLIFVDTAGIRDTEDAIESLGISRSKEALKKADKAVLVFDVNNIDYIGGDLITAASFNIDDLVFVFNKIDLYPVNRSKTISQAYSKLWGDDFLQRLAIDLTEFTKRCFFLSAESGDGCRELLDFLSKDFTGSFGSEAIVTNARHFQCLQSALGYLDLATKELQEGIGLEFVSVNLKAGLLEIQAALGVSFDDQILDRVFSEFCIGK